MATSSKKTGRSSGSKGEPTVVYRGIKIAPIAGKRSKTSAAIREGLEAIAGKSAKTTARDRLKAKAASSRGRSAHA